LHVIQRGNNRAACFHSDVDRKLYLKLLLIAAGRHRCLIHAYVLMPNHAHLLTTPEQPGGVASMMQDLGRRYVRIFNDVHARTGTLWEGRYKAAMIDSERYFLICQRYIELNPVRAGMVTAPADYPWSSHRHYAYGTNNALVTPHLLVQSLAPGDAERREAYLALFREKLGPELINAIRSATNQGWAVGSEAFLQRVGAILGRAVRPPKRGRPKKRKDGDDDPGEKC
jgi:putative transposase